MASQITSLTIVYSNVYSGSDQRKHQSSVSLAFVRGIHRWPVNSPHNGPVTRKMFPFDDVIMLCTIFTTSFVSVFIKRCQPPIPVLKVVYLEASLTLSVSANIIHFTHYGPLVRRIRWLLWIHLTKGFPVRPCAKVMALFLNVKIFKLWLLQISNFLKLWVFQTEVLVSTYVKFHWNLP